MAKAITQTEKAAVASVCDRFIAETLKPKFLPEIRPTEFNYPVDIVGKWRGNKYSFIVRYRSGFPDNAGEEFDAAFVRLDYLGKSGAETRFNVLWHRHTGEWFLLHVSVTLAEALSLIETEPFLHPPV
ncbi:MAG: hypothetical protein ACHQ50_18025 [Fimbriimonadales bacterium]